MHIDHSKLVELLADTAGIDIDKAEQQLAELVAEINEAIEEGEAYEVDGLGVFSGIGNNIIFMPDKELATEINYKYAGMEPIEMDDAPAEPESSAPDAEDDDSLVESDEPADAEEDEDPFAGLIDDEDESEEQEQETETAASFELDAEAGLDEEEATGVSDLADEEEDAPFDLADEELEDDTEEEVPEEKPGPDEWGIDTYKDDSAESMFSGLLGEDDSEYSSEEEDEEDDLPDDFSSLFDEDEDDPEIEDDLAAELSKQFGDDLEEDSDDDDLLGSMFDDDDDTDLDEDSEPEDNSLLQEDEGVDSVEDEEVEVESDPAPEPEEEMEAEPDIDIQTGDEENIDDSDEKTEEPEAESEEEDFDDPFAELKDEDRDDEVIPVIKNLTSEGTKKKREEELEEEETDSETDDNSDESEANASSGKDKKAPVLLWILLTVAILGGGVYGLGYFGIVTIPGITPETQMASNINPPAQNNTTTNQPADEQPQTSEQPASAAQPPQAERNTQEQPAQTQVSQNEQVPANQPTYGLRGVPVSEANDGFTIVIYSLSKESNARAKQRELSNEGYRVLVASIPSQQYGRLYRVSLGQFESQRDAAIAAETLEPPFTESYFITQIQ